MHTFATMCVRMKDREGKRRKLAHILQSISSSEDRLNRAIIALEETIDQGEQEVNERNRPGKCTT